MLKKQLAFNEKETHAHQLLKEKLIHLGIILNVQSGHLTYSDSFQPLLLNFGLIFVRHGETYGNCGQSTKDGKIDPVLVKKKIKDKEKRIFQGSSDTEINQLTRLGKKQADLLAKKLENQFLKRNWIPDQILVSPLRRAQETAFPFIKKYYFEKNFSILEAIKEISFGHWENKRICDFHNNDVCHLFYKEQNSLVKGLDFCNDKNSITAENFSELLLRTRAVLMDLNNQYAGKKIIMFSHSMFGAACLLLLGLGQRVEHHRHLAFDGNKSDGTPYTLPHTEPILLNNLSA